MLSCLFQRYRQTPATQISNSPTPLYDIHINKCVLTNDVSVSVAITCVSVKIWRFSETGNIFKTLFIVHVCFATITKQGAKVIKNI